MRRSLCALILACLPAMARADPPMLIATSPHFTIYAAQSREDLQAFADSLETYDAVLRQLTHVPAAAGDVAPLTIYVKPDQYSLDAGWGVLGYYNASVAGSFAVVPQTLRWIRLASLPQIILFHEYAHHFILQNFPGLYSPWFVEGIAEFYSTVEIAPDSVTFGKPEPMRIRDLNGRLQTSLRYLLNPGDKSLTFAQTSELYARAWLLVHYLTLSKERGGQINAYIKARDSGASEDAAFKSAFGISIQDMDKELRRYFAPHTLGYATIRRPHGGSVSIRAATQAEIETAAILPRLRNLQDRKEGLGAFETSRSDRTLIERAGNRLAADARKFVAKFPGDAAVQEVFAESLLLADENGEARAAARKAVELAPKSARAHLTVASAALAEVDKSNIAAIAAARREVVAANRLAPNDPLPLLRYYRSYADFGITPPEIAIRGLDRAYELAPQDDSLRMLLAKEQIGARRYVRAAALLRPVAFAPHPGPRRSTAKKLLDALPGATPEGAPAANPVDGTSAASAPPGKAGAVEP